MALSANVDQRVDAGKLGQVLLRPEYLAGRTATSSRDQQRSPAYEAALMPALQRTFNYIVPGMEALPGFLKRLLLSDATVEVRHPPLQQRSRLK
jgi:hypothetical protein